MRILWLFGPPGVGNSVTAWEVLDVPSDRGEPTTYVDIDQRRPGHAAVLHRP